MLHTTLTILRQKGACTSGYRTLLASLPKGHADDEPITLLHILESNGIKDAIWALCAAIEPTGKAVAVELACRAATRALVHFEKRYPEDKRPHEAIEAARAYQRGEITRKQLADKRDAAAAAYAAYAAADAYAAYAAADAYAAAYAAYAAADAYAAAYAAERKVQAADLRELLDALSPENGNG